MQLYVREKQDLRIKEENLSKASVLLTVLLELQLHTLNRLQNETKTQQEVVQFQKQEEDFIGFLRKHLTYIDPAIAYSLMQTHGRFQNFIKYMEMRKDYESLIQHYINEENVK